MTTTKPPTLTADELTDAMESLHGAWMECGKPLGEIIDLIDAYYMPIDLMRGDQATADTIAAEIEARCPGLLSAAHSYANHIEAGQPDYDQQRFIRRLFTAEMGRDPFGQPTPG
jgi:hypothetical protein